LGELTSRALCSIVGIALIIVGVVGMSETVLPTKTSLAPSTMAVRIMGPATALLGVGLFMFGRTVPRKHRPSPMVLTIAGTAITLAPALIWTYGAALAREDAAFWAPAVAAALLVLTVPGLGMAIGGLRRLGRHVPEPSRPVQPGPKVKRRK